MKQKWNGALLIGLLVLLSVSGMISAQQQTSSGSQTVSVTNFPSSQVVTQSSGANLRANIDNFPASFGVSNFPATQAVTQSGVWTVKTTPLTTCGTTAYDTGDVALPTTLTLASGSTDTCINMVELVNTTGADRTVQLTNGAGTFSYLPSTFKLAASSATTVNLGGHKVVGGLKWSADAAGVQGFAVGVQ